MIGGDADVGGARFDHLQNGVQHSGNRAKGFVLAFIPAALAVEVSEQLVRSVDQVDYHCREMVTSKYPL
jgi:hypothetical protein